jgi:methylase of polypeptide subunit release factors
MGARRLVRRARQRRFDALASNPPYIAGDDPVLSGDGLAHEPRGALTPEGDGIAALATLINGAPGHLSRAAGSRSNTELSGPTLRSLLVAVASLT